MDPAKQQQTDADAANNAPLIPWGEAVAGVEAALEQLRATLDEMKEVSDAMAKLVIKQLDPIAIDEPGAETAQQAN